MNIKHIEPSDSGRWEAYLNSSPKSIAWQSYRWNEAVSALYDVQFHALAAEDHGTIRGILPLYGMSTAGGRCRLISVPYAVAGGLCADDEGAGSMLIDAAIDLSRKLGADSVTLKQYRHSAPGPLATDGHYFNRELSLSMGVDGVWKQLHGQNKRAIEAADRQDLCLEYPSSQADLFYGVLLRFLTRSGLPCPPAAWIRTLLALKMYGIALLRRGDEVVAGTMVKSFKTTVSFPFTCFCGTSESMTSLGYPLYWRLLQRFAGEGYEIFHSGRIPESEDVPAYRLGWGGTKHPYFYQYYPDPGTSTEYGAKRGWKRVILTNCWKWLPMCVAEAIGPKVVARYP